MANIEDQKRKVSNDFLFIPHSEKRRRRKIEKSRRTRFYAVSKSIFRNCECFGRRSCKVAITANYRRNSSRYRLYFYCKKYSDVFIRVVELAGGDVDKAAEQILSTLEIQALHKEEEEAQRKMKEKEHLAILEEVQ